MATKTKEQSIREYLIGIATQGKPQVDKEGIKALKAQIKEAERSKDSDPLETLKLYAELERKQEGEVRDLSGEEAAFVANAKEYAEEQGIPVVAFQRAGVSDDVLKKAGFDVKASSKSASTGGGRKSSLTLDEVKKKLPSGDFKISDLASTLDRSTMTTRNYVTKLVEAGAIREVGEDSSGPGRAAKVYRKA
jgi:hypothetical protein